MVGASVFGNILVLVVIYKSKELRHSQYTYKSSIAISDIIWGSILSYSFISELVRTLLKNSFAVVTLDYSQQMKESIDNVTNYYYGVQILTFLPNRLPNSPDLFNPFNFVLSAALLVSILTLVFAALDRYFALAYPLKYRSYNTSKYAKIVTVAIWVSCIIFFGYSLIHHLTSSPFRYLVTNLYLQPLAPSFENDNLFMKFFSNVLFVIFISLWLVTILTITSLYKNYKRSKKLNRSISNRVALEKQMSFILLAMVIAFTVCLTLTLFGHICYHFCPLHLYQKIGTKVTLISLSLLATNSIWNFVIYNVMNRKFRAALIKLFKRKQLQTSINTVSTT